jgi:hypothetical protein
MRTTAGQSGEILVPPEVNGWSWGAFLLSGIWSIGNRVWIGLLSFIPLGAIIMPFVLGAKGNEWAWRKKAWRGTDHFKSVQRTWTYWGIGIWSMIVVGAVIAGALATFDAGGALTKDIHSEDTNLTISVPGTWSEERRLDEAADLAAAHEFGEAYVLVYTHSRFDFIDDFRLEDFVRVTTREFIKETGGRRLGELVKTSLDGHRALQQTITGISGGVKVTYLYTATATSRRFIQVMAWTLASDYAETEDTLMDVSGSLSIPDPPALPGDLG